MHIVGPANERKLALASFLEEHGPRQQRGGPRAPRLAEAASIFCAVAESRAAILGHGAVLTQQVRSDCERTRRARLAETEELEAAAARTAAGG